MLFIILFLHQTTTCWRCYVSIFLLFIILFLHQTTTFWRSLASMSCCLSSCSYIKPQRRSLHGSRRRRCLSSCSYIKPQLVRPSRFSGVCCLSSCSYIKPQPLAIAPAMTSVVYHLVPTSNHNELSRLMRTRAVVYHLVPTSNHNRMDERAFVGWLFIILFLHQTTT